MGEPVFARSLFRMRFLGMRYAHDSNDALPELMGNDAEDLRQRDTAGAHSP